nr:hypothetical protein [Steroidobacter cummioxidans]
MRAKKSKKTPARASSRFNPQRQFNQLPMLPPAADIETKTILKACISARAALEGLKQAGAQLPNQTVL